MKRVTLLLLFLVFSLLCAGALAGPAVTNGQATAWIAGDGVLMLQDAGGVVRQLAVTAIDLPWMSKDSLCCVTGTGERLVLSMDGSQISAAVGTPAESPEQTRITLENGVLSLDGIMLSAAVSTYTHDSAFVYYIEQEGENRTLRVRSMQENGAEGRDVWALALDGRPVAQAQSLTVTQDALTMTGADRQVTVFDLRTGGTLELPVSEAALDAACMMNNTLYRYTCSDAGLWTLTGTEQLPAANAAAAPTQAGQPTAIPTAVPTATPSPTPRPTATPTPKPTATPKSFIDEDGTIHKGASGAEVKKIQNRLAELGYPVGNADGKYGDNTQLAINLFCDAIHVREHNYITPSVKKKLFSSSAPEYDPYLPLEKGDRGVSVLYMQKRLKELGYDPGKLDGIYGDNTVAAVAKFQKDFDLKPGTGKKPGEYATHKLLEILFTTISEEMEPVDPEPIHVEPINPEL